MCEMAQVSAEQTIARARVAAMAAHTLCKTAQAAVQCASAASRYVEDIDIG